MSSQVKYSELYPDQNQWKNTLLGVSIAICIVGGLLFGFGVFGVVEVNPELTEIGADVFFKYVFIIVAASVPVQGPRRVSFYPIILPMSNIFREQ